MAGKASDASGRPAPDEPGGSAPAKPGGSAPDAPGGPGPEDVPTRLVVVAYALALLCAVAPLAVLGAGFAGAVLYGRGRRGAGAGVVAVAVLCAALGIALRS